jgi:hypothetical protein
MELERLVPQSLTPSQMYQVRETSIGPLDFFLDDHVSSVIVSTV